MHSTSPENRLLVVDDEQAICFAIRNYFETQGYEVDSAQSIAEAESLLRDGCYTVLIADLNLTGGPNLDGLELIKYVRHHYPAIRILILSAYSLAEVGDAANELVADVFLHKPKPLAELAQVVSRLAGNQ